MIYNCGDMTQEEQDSALGALIREYKENGECVVLLSAGIREAAATLNTINESLDPPTQSTLYKVVNVDTTAISKAVANLDQLRKALERREQLKSDLIRLGMDTVVQL